jgi:hypothetical protein
LIRVCFHSFSYFHIGILHDKDAVARTVLAQMGKEAMALERKQALVGREAANARGLMLDLPAVESRYLAAVRSDDDHRKRVRIARDAVTRDALLALHALPHGPVTEAVFAAVSVALLWTTAPERVDLSWRTGGSRLAATPDELLALLAESTGARCVMLWALVTALRAGFAACTPQLSPFDFVCMPCCCHFTFVLQYGHVRLYHGNNFTAQLDPVA